MFGTSTGLRGTHQTLAEGGTCTPNASSSTGKAIQSSILVLCVIVASTDTQGQSLSVATCGARGVPRASAGGTHVITGKAPGGHILDDGLQGGLAAPRGEFGA